MLDLDDRGHVALAWNRTERGDGDGRCSHFDEGRLLLTIEAVAELLSLGRTTVYELVATRELPSVKIGRSRRVSYQALHRFVERLSDVGPPQSECTSVGPRAA
jgi:excisionase family DNA binding protein